MALTFAGAIVLVPGDKIEVGSYTTSFDSWLFQVQGMAPEESRLICYIKAAYDEMIAGVSELVVAETVGIYDRNVFYYNGGKNRLFLYQPTSSPIRGSVTVNAYYYA